MVGDAIVVFCYKSFRMLGIEVGREALHRILPRIHRRLVRRGRQPVLTPSFDRSSRVVTRGGEIHYTLLGA
jgi:hypothetical protein